MNKKEYMKPSLEEIEPDVTSELLTATTATNLYDDDIDVEGSGSGIGRVRGFDDWY